MEKIGEGCWVDLQLKKMTQEQILYAIEMIESGKGCFFMEREDDLKLVSIIKRDYLNNE